MGRYSAFMYSTARWSRSSKNQPRRHSEVVVAGVEFAGRDLHACAKHNPRPRFGIGWVECALADDHSGRDELLGLSVIRSTLVERGIALHLGPKQPGHAVLRHRVPQHRPS